MIRKIAAVPAGSLLLASLGTGAASAAGTSHNWMVNNGALGNLYSYDQVTANYFWNRPGSYAEGNGTVSSNPVPDGLAATGVLRYTSYTQFLSDVNNHVITWPYKWVKYDNESWSQTPANEQADPGKYMAAFEALADVHGYSTILEPARDLANSDTVCAWNRGTETMDQWYLRCIPKQAAVGDLYQVQTQADEQNIPAYQALFNGAKTQARAVNPAIVMDAEVSTDRGTATQMTAAAESVAPDGYHITASDTAVFDQFLKNMKAAGY